MKYEKSPLYHMKNRDIWKISICLEVLFFYRIGGSD